ncbi:DUF58 domain-containing protein [soil metagenome]
MLPSSHFRMLDRLRLNPRKSFGGRVRGERLTKKKGVSIEFADYREYSDGDDLRHLDWNVLARLDSTVMRTYQDEEDLAVHVLLDVSPSMDFGDPTKLEQARNLASTFGYVALNGGDAVQAKALGIRSNAGRILRGRASYPRLSNALESFKAPETTQETLSVALRSFAATTSRTGIVLILSDGLDPDVANAVKILGGRGHEVWFLQILSPVEIDPDLEGDLRLIDGEGGTPREITANSYVLKEYKTRLTAHNTGLADAARRVGGRYALISADQNFEDLLKNVLKRQGWLV